MKENILKIHQTEKIEMELLIDEKKHLYETKIVAKIVYQYKFCYFSNKAKTEDKLSVTNDPKN